MICSPLYQTISPTIQFAILITSFFFIIFIIQV
nr:MAG TPA: hypothetical protein [Caudoviricetes sp.]